MKKMLLLASLLVCQACSNGNGGETMSGAQCSSWGGKMVNGKCQKKLAAEDQKKMCDKLGLEYSEKYNGCLQS